MCFLNLNIRANSHWFGLAIKFILIHMKNHALPQKLSCDVHDNYTSKLTNKIYEYKIKLKN